MEVAIISPTSMLEFSNLTQYHLILPHLLQDRTYFEFYRDQTGFKILDNGVAEGQRVTEGRKLLAAAEAVGADEVVAPDVLHDWINTVAQTKAFERVASGNFQYMGVVQGRNVDEAAKCVASFVRLSYINTLGVPRNMISYAQRTNFIRYVLDTYPDRFESIHCLGANAHIEEPKILSQLPVRGIDTSLPIVLGIEGMRLENAAYMSRLEDYFKTNIPTHDDRYKTIRHNVEEYIRWAKQSVDIP